MYKIIDELLYAFISYCNQELRIANGSGKIKQLRMFERNSRAKMISILDQECKCNNAAQTSATFGLRDWRKIN